MNYYISQLVRLLWLVNIAGRILLYGPLYSGKLDSYCKKMSWNKTKDLETLEKIKTRNKCFLILLSFSHTPRNVGVSSKHVRSFSYYSNSMWLAITATVERTCSPAVRGRAVTQIPTSTWIRKWLQKTSEVTDEEAVASDNTWLLERHFLKKIKYNLNL